MSAPDPILDLLPAHILVRLSPWLQAAGWVVGFSGGLDSTVLLHALVTQARRGGCPPVSAIHVHHGLQPAADDWPEHCAWACAALSVPLSIRRVKVEPGASLEAAARAARYAAFVDALEPGQILLTAQHRDDQAETLLFRLLRGAGVLGMAAMPSQRALGQGWLVRPLLDRGRDELERYARAAGLEWVEDPSNQDVRFARNYLRQAVMPVLGQRWPKAANALARSAAHMRDAQELLDELAQQDLARAHLRPFDWLDVPCLDLEVLRALSPPRQRNALRYWLAPLTALPDTEHWGGWESLRDAALDATPLWQLAGGVLQRSGMRAWWVDEQWHRLHPEQDWLNPSQALPLEGNGALHIEGRPPAGSLRVRYRVGGERMRMEGRGARDLKRLFNEQGIPGFLRGRLPLLFSGEELLAVANLPGLDGPRGGEWRLRWSPPTNDQRLS